MTTARESFLNDEHFQDVLIGLLVYDREFCKTVSHMLTPEDFAGTVVKKKGVGTDAGNEREEVARLALDFYNRFRQPLGKMLMVELTEHARMSGWSGASLQRLIAYGESLTPSVVRTYVPDAAVEKIIAYKTELELVRALTEAQNLMDKGVLSMEEFLRLAREAADKVHTNNNRPVSILSEKQLELRVARRNLQTHQVRFPALLIDPLDRMIRIIARKHLGLILAPYKRGKTMFFVWLALAYVVQSLNVLHFTLEDPKEDIEDRFDAAITNLPMSRLTENTDKVRQRFQRFKKYAKTKLKVMDGTDGDMSIQKIEAVYEQERNRGFTADVILVDYDDEITPRKKQQERRMEFADIYRDFRSFIARRELIGWTASQTTRKSEDMKIISGKESAEDISKIRKSSFCLSLGKGDWGDDSVFLWVAAHRYDRMHVGANIITSKDRSLFYDRERTIAREKEEAAKAVKP